MNRTFFIITIGVLTVVTSVVGFAADGLTDVVTKTAGKAVELSKPKPERSRARVALRKIQAILCRMLTLDALGHGRR